MKREIFRAASSSRLARDLCVCSRDGALARDRVVIRARATARAATCEGYFSKRDRFSRE